MVFSHQKENLVPSLKRVMRLVCFPCFILVWYASSPLWRINHLYYYHHRYYFMVFPSGLCWAIRFHSTNSINSNLKLVQYQPILLVSIWLYVNQFLSRTVTLNPLVLTSVVLDVIHRHIGGDEGSFAVFFLILLFSQQSCLCIFGWDDVFYLGPKEKPKETTSGWDIFTLLGKKCWTEDSSKENSLRPWRNEGRVSWLALR